MTVLPRRLYVHVEEPSMQAVMQVLLPRLIVADAVPWQIIDHGSKHALLNDLPRRLAGYARRLAREDLRVLVLVDRDDDDCIALKRRLEDMAGKVGLATRSAPDAAGRFCVVNRIVVEELESWFFGDAPAVCAAYAGVPASLEARAAFRDPDAIKGGTWEALERVLKRAGHYAGTHRLPKIEVARRIAPHLQPDRNRSDSFRQFRLGLTALVGA